MTNSPDDHSLVAQERRVLQALCTRGQEFLKAAEPLLSGYGWREPVHQVIFTCLTGLSTRSPLTLRESLAQCATRKGFPDVDWAEFFPVSAISTGECEVILRQLLDGGTADLQDA